jgi:CRISPR-associated protein (TIGR03984 family)
MASYQRAIIPYRANIIDVDVWQKENFKEWLKAQATAPMYILAHALDGVIWGWVTQDGILTSREVSPPLKIETLLQLRLFNADCEIRLWHVGEDWRAVKTTDEEDTSAAAIDEPQLLWGTHATRGANTFTQLEDGSQGLIHAVPLEQSLDGNLGLRDKKTLQRVCLHVRHYLTEDAMGVNSVTISRLLGLGVENYG